MSGQALYRKWRPQLWDEVVGQEHVVQTLRNALRSEHVAHAYLFAGPRGCGKTTSARLVAKAVNCLHADPAQRPDNTCLHCVAVNEGRFLDLIEIDGASNNGVENIRELRDKINFAPSEGRRKIYIIDEVHMLSQGAFNALLKTLEEPPPHAIFILATTELHKIPATVTSRCQRFVFRRIPVKEIMARLRALCEQENLNVEEAALEMIARQATGALRDAISLLDQLVSSDSVVTLARAQELLGTASGQAVLEVVEALSKNDTAAGLAALSQAVDTGTDPRQLARQMTDYLRGLMLVRTGNAALVEATTEARQTMAGQAQRFELAALLRAIRAFTAAANDVRGGWQPQLPLELALVECAAPLSVVEPMAATPAASAFPATSAPARTTRPATPPAPPPAPTAAPVSSGGVDLKSAWTQLLTLMREKDKATHGLLNSSKVVGLEGNVLRLSSNEFVAKQINDQAKTRQLINSLLTQVMGFECGVKCEVAGRARASANDDIPADGLVSTALGLGGEIVE